MLPVLLALGCALCYGGSDYTSGRAVRRAGLLQVTVTAEVIRAGLVIAIVPLASSQSPSPGSLAWGVAAGVGGVAGIMALNLGFQHTAFGVVSPISAVVAATVPVLVGLNVAVASRLAKPGDRPEDGAVTVKLAEADAPGVWNRGLATE
jgi:drug/metabolite transporter (DMT)-like permease